MATISAHPYAPMSIKRQKMTAKRGRASEEPTRNYNHDKFVNESAAERFSLISKNRSFIEEKGFHHPEDFFRKTITNNGWKALFQPPTPAATMVVREFYANLASHMNKKVSERGIWVNFYAKYVKTFYNLEPWTLRRLIAFMRPRTTPRSLGY